MGDAQAAPLIPSPEGRPQTIGMIIGTLFDGHLLPRDIAKDDWPLRVFHIREACHLAYSLHRVINALVTFRGEDAILWLGATRCTQSS